MSCVYWTGERTKESWTPYISEPDSPFAPQPLQDTSLLMGLRVITSPLSSLSMRSWSSLTVQIPVWHLISKKRVSSIWETREKKLYFSMAIISQDVSMTVFPVNSSVSFVLIFWLEARRGMRRRIVSSNRFIFNVFNILV